MLSTVIGKPSLHHRTCARPYRPAAQRCWPVPVMLVAKNDSQVVGVKTEHEVDVMAIMIVMTAVVMAITVAVPMAPMGWMAMAVVTPAFVVMASVLVAMFVTVPVAVPITIISAMAMITVPPALFGFAVILLIMAVLATIAIPGVRDQW